MQEDLERLLKLMKPIKYGWVGYDGEKHERIGKKFVENCLIPLPPLSEQLKIVRKINYLFEEIF